MLLLCSKDSYNMYRSAVDDLLQRNFNPEEEIRQRFRNVVDFCT